MTQYEYKVVPAPEKGQRVKGVKGPRERFAHVLETLMNDLGAEGWDYLRADTLPCEERSGLTGKTVVYQNMLVFRRAVGGVEAGLSDPEVAGLLAAPGAAPAPAVSGTSAAGSAPAPVAERDEAEMVDHADNRTAAAAAVAALRANRGTDASGQAPKLGPATAETNGTDDSKPGGLAAE